MLEKKTVVLSIEVDPENFNTIFVTERTTLIEDGEEISVLETRNTCYTPDTDKLTMPEKAHKIVDAVWDAETVENYKKDKEDKE